MSTRSSIQTPDVAWRDLSALYALVEAALDKSLRSEHDLSLVEFKVLDALSRQENRHLRMGQIATAAALSPSAATRLVTRLEGRRLMNRVLCAGDRRGIMSQLTDVGHKLVERARPTHHEVLEVTLARASMDPELTRWVELVRSVPPAGN